MMIKLVRLAPALLLLAACEPAGESGGEQPAAAEAEKELAAVGSPAHPSLEAAKAQQVPTQGKASMIELPPLVRGQSRIPPALQGEWVVARQTVVGGGVQAYGDDDPSVVGGRLRLSATDASWTGSKALTGTCNEVYFDGEANGAALTAAREELGAPLRGVGASERGLRELQFLCMGESSDWGPSEELLNLLVLNDGRLAMRWFDNLLLVLERSTSR